MSPPEAGAAGQQQRTAATSLPAAGVAGDPRPGGLSAEDAWGLVQELQARQAELQAQNAELQRTQAALLESEEQLRFLSGNLADGMVYQIDSGPDCRERRFSYVAPAVQRFHGVSVADVLRDPGCIYGQVIEPDRALVLTREEQAVVTRTPLDVEVRVRLPSGEVRWRHFRSAPRVRADGHVVWDGIELDITDKRRAEEEHERLRSDLVQLQKLEAVGRLAGGVAHDVNNALQAIGGHAELALMETGLPGTVRADLEGIRKTAQHSASLTRQLLTFARRQIAAPQVLDLNEAVAGALGMLRRLIGEQIELTWQPADDLYPVRIDPGHVGQILVNLCLNARDAISGAGEIRVSTERLLVEATGTTTGAGLAPGHYAVLVVSDTGSGMREEVVARIFEPFYTTKGMAGTGLGLAMVYGLVTQNRGRIEVESRPGQGTVFRIYLPRAAATAVAGPAAAGAVPRARPGETVLLVEDDAGSLETCQRLLASLGYTVLSAADGVAALALAERHPGDIALLLTDVVMPGLPVDELARRLQAVRPGVRCLFMSGYPDEAIRRRGALGGGMPFIGKPFSLEQIAVKVREVLDSPAPPGPGGEPARQ